MAKEISAADVAAFFTAKGLDVPETVQAQIENAKADEAFHKVEKILVPSIKGAKRTQRAEGWQKNLFSLAREMTEEFKSETVNQQGRGNAQVVRRQVTIETEHGTLYVKVWTPAPAATETESASE